MSDVPQRPADWIAGPDGSVVRAESEPETVADCGEGKPVEKVPVREPGRLGDRCPEHHALSEKLKEVNHRSSHGGGLR